MIDLAKMAGQWVDELSCDDDYFDDAGGLFPFDGANRQHRRGSCGQPNFVAA